MDSEYSIEYKKMSKNGVLDISYTKVSIRAEGKDTALVTLREQLANEGVSEIRIGRVINKSTPHVIKVSKKKRSILGWIAGGIFIIGMSAKVLNKFIWKWFVMNILHEYEVEKANFK